jgi:hypothetical protein
MRLMTLSKDGGPESTVRVDRVRATGNGQVPAVAALAWEILSSVLLETI